MRSAIAGSRNLRMLLVAIMVTVCVPAYALDEALFGVWKGHWHLGMSSGSAILTLRDAESTLEMTNNDEFGTAPAVLTGIDVTQRSLVFRAVGQNGVAFVARLPLANDNRSLRGYARYGAVRVLLNVALTAQQ